MINMISKLILVAAALLLTGCTGSKNIQDLTYIVSIGLDYNEENELYTAYLQGLNFANVAKQEGSKPTEPVPTFVGSASGKTLNMAVRNLYKASRPSLFFGHTKTLVVSKNLIKFKFKEVLEDVGRNRSLRPNLLLFTTDESMEEIFKLNGLFQYPPVYTVLLTEETVEALQDDISATSLMHFLREYYEPMGTAFIPNISIDKKSWQTDQPYPVLYLSGYSLFQQSQFKGDLPSKPSIIVDWLLTKKNQIDYPLYIDDELVSTFKLLTKEPKIKYKEERGDFSTFSLEVSVKAELIEKLVDSPYKDVKSTLEKSLENEIKKVYNIGLEKQVDLLNVGEKWYRYHPLKFRKLEEQPSFYLTDHSLDEVKVKVDITHFNAYRYDHKSME
ncbi:MULTISPECIES: Ger(x)C family spore germination protein [unclassified Rossellomorea]|uniref:Ger(x)C family spore germination protein n=1 Tax=unclassified Rossellomorea TaxID=2837526 RepID=UPI0026364013|nr:Ger(x)C family spore germination protein [uncultured Rossellomorea sp.]